MKRLKIALDCDGFLSDFMNGALRVVEEVTGKRFVSADVVAEWDFCKALGLTFRETHLVKKTIGRRRGFVTSLLPYPLARQGVRRLRELGEVFVVTSPWDSNPWWREEREAWLALHFGIDVVHHAADKTVYEADVFVDDRSDHVSAWLGAWPGRTAVLWRTLHNTSEAVPCGAYSTDSWEELYQIARDTALERVQQQVAAGARKWDPFITRHSYSANSWRHWMQSTVGNVSSRLEVTSALKRQGTCSGADCQACVHCAVAKIRAVGTCLTDAERLPSLVEVHKDGMVDSCPDDMSSADPRLKGTP